MTDDYTGNKPAEATVAAGATVTLPDNVSRTGYTLAGWVDVDTGKLTKLNETFIMPAQNVTLKVQWTMNAPIKLSDSETVVLEDGTEIKQDSTTVTITTREGEHVQQTVVTLPSGTTNVTIENGEVIVSAGSTVVTTTGTTITIGGGNPDGSGTATGKVDGAGTVYAPVVSKVTTGD